MGMPYGRDTIYGKGLYSRKYGWWRDDTCTPKGWFVSECRIDDAELPQQVAVRSSGWQRTMPRRVRR